MDELLQKLTELWNRFSQHIHDGVDAPRISYNDLTDVPGTLFTGNIQVLLVGGGGNGAGGIGTFPGGGGGGGLTYDAAHQVIAHIGFDQAYPIVISKFGTGVDTTFHNLTGGRGGDGGAGSPGAGGAAGVGATANGGAGGAGSVAGAGGNGGNGTANSITGASVTYGGAGGGHGGAGEGTGGSGGGTAGNSGTNGTDGLGGGGGGTAAPSPPHGGDGICIIRYVTASFGPCTGGTITTLGSDTIHTFTSNGTFTVVAR